MVICVFGCVTIPKYAEELRKINSTWGSQPVCDLKILFFLGEERSSEFIGDQYVYLTGVSNDYMSASYKQFLGLKHVYEQHNPEFVMCCGTDTFINIPKLLQFLNRFNANDKLYIGGHGDTRDILGKQYYFHSGGAGFVLSRAALAAFYPLCDTAVDRWIDVCLQWGEQNRKPACDLAMSYLLQTQLNDVKTIKADENTFLGCNYTGWPCHQGNVRIDNIITCHSMTLQDCDNFYRILQHTNFFMSE